MTHAPPNPGRRIAPALALLLCTVTGGLVVAAPAFAAPDWRDSLRAGRQLIDAGTSDDAESLAHRGLEPFADYQPPDSLLLAESLDLLVAVLQRTGRTRRDETLAHAERVVALRERRQGPEHPDVATSLVGLAIVQRARGDFPGSKANF